MERLEGENYWDYRKRRKRHQAETREKLKGKVFFRSKIWNGIRYIGNTYRRPKEQEI